MLRHEAIALIEANRIMPNAMAKEAWQSLVDSGDVWLLPAPYPAEANKLIEAGVIKAKKIIVG